MRKAHVSRNTQETQITLEINLDGQGKAELDSGVPFFIICWIRLPVMACWT